MLGSGDGGIDFGGRRDASWFTGLVVGGAVFSVALQIVWLVTASG
jgi:hypothetical protein